MCPPGKKPRAQQRESEPQPFSVHQPLRPAGSRSSSRRQKVASMLKWNRETVCDVLDAVAVVNVEEKTDVKQCAPSAG